MSDPLFKYTSDPMDLAMAGCIVDDVERLAASDCGEPALREEVARLDRLIEFLEGKVANAARVKMISALRVKGELLLKLGDRAAAVTHLNQSLELYARYGEDEPEAARLIALLNEHSPDLRAGLDGLAAARGAVPSRWRAALRAPTRYTREL